MTWEEVEVREWFFYGSLSLSAMDFGATHQPFNYIENTQDIFNMDAVCT